MKKIMFAIHYDGYTTRDIIENADESARKALLAVQKSLEKCNRDNEKEWPTTLSYVVYDDTTEEGEAMERWFHLYDYVDNNSLMNEEDRNFFFDVTNWEKYHELL